MWLCVTEDRVKLEVDVVVCNSAVRVKLVVDVVVCDKGL